MCKRCDNARALALRIAPCGTRAPFAANTRSASSFSHTVTEYERKERLIRRRPPKKKTAAAVACRREHGGYSRR